jgi:hypothetical protein
MHFVRTGAALSLVFGGEPESNSIIILADDMGYPDNGCYGGDVSTPKYTNRYLL